MICAEVFRSRSLSSCCPAHTASRVLAKRIISRQQVTKSRTRLPAFSNVSDELTCRAKAYTIAQGKGLRPQILSSPFFKGDGVMRAKRVSSFLNFAPELPSFHSISSIKDVLVERLVRWNEAGFGPPFAKPLLAGSNMDQVLGNSLLSSSLRQGWPPSVSTVG